MTLDATARPATRWKELWFTGFAGLATVWLPLAVIEQIDGLRAFRTWQEITADLALLIVMLAGGMMALSALVLVASSAWRDDKARWAVARNCILLPVAAICAWQFTYDVKHWFEAVSGLRLAIPAALRLAMLSAIAALAVWLYRRSGVTRSAYVVAESLRSVRPLLITILALSCGLLLWHPPTVVFSKYERGASADQQIRDQKPPDIYLISIDTLSDLDADVCGTTPPLMPRLRQLAASSTCFARAYASSNFTTPTTATLETGALPWSHWATQIDAKVIAPLRSHALGAVLSAGGYATYSVSANPLASPRQHGTFRAYGAEILVPSDSLRERAREALEVFPDSSLPPFLYSALSFLATADVYLNGTHYPYDPERVYGVARSLITASDPRRPTFIWMHTMPPHSPYLPAPSTRYRLLPPGQLETWHELLPEDSFYTQSQQQLVDRHRYRYRECILGADAALGGVLDYLASSGRLSKAWVVITADHGESFEKGYLGHAGDLLHEALLRIPLVIKAPGQTVGRVIQTPVSQADIAATIFEMAGVEAPANLEGRSIMSALYGRALEPRPVFSMALERTSRFTTLRGGHIAVIDGFYKLIYHVATNRSELYELAGDPHENHDASALYPEVALRLRKLLGEHLRQVELNRQHSVGS